MGFFLILIGIVFKTWILVVIGCVILALED